ncbi:MAG TPA: hypothetical protein VMV18_13515 [bacterium]|nr:hypothetical protein [bacterium]
MRGTRQSSESGQAGVEYMAVVSVVVIAVVSAAWTFAPSFRDGVQSLASDVSSILDTGEIGGVGLPRSGSANAGDAVSPAGSPEGGLSAPLGAPVPASGSGGFRDAGALGHNPVNVDDPMSIEPRIPGGGIQNT